MMKRPSPALAMLVFFWLVYGLFAAVVLYRALPPLQLELLVILGGVGSILVVASLVLLWGTPPPGRSLGRLHESSGQQARS